MILIYKDKSQCKTSKDVISSLIEKFIYTNASVEQQGSDKHKIVNFKTSSVSCQIHI